MWAEDVANFKPYLRPFQNGQPNSWLYFRLSTTTRLSATNYLLIDAGESTDQRRIEKAPDCNRTPPKLIAIIKVKILLLLYKAYKCDSSIAIGVCHIVTLARM